MSHDQGRPSLFAGMEDGSAAGSDTQRVRILSTLESTRRATRPTRKGPSSKGGKPGDSKVWHIALGLGIVAVMLSFILIVQGQKHAPLPLAKAPLVMPSAPAVSASTSVVAESASAALTAEAAASDAILAEAALESLPPTAAASAADAARDPLATLASHEGAASSPMNTAATTTLPDNNQKPRAAAKPAKTAKSSRSRNDRDVELIEAVMNHGAARGASR